MVAIIIVSVCVYVYFFSNSFIFKTFKLTEKVKEQYSEQLYTFHVDSSIVAILQYLLLSACKLTSEPLVLNYKTLLHFIPKHLSHVS